MRELRVPVGVDEGNVVLFQIHEGEPFCAQVVHAWHGFTAGSFDIPGRVVENQPVENILVVLGRHCGEGLGFQAFFPDLVFYE